MVFVRITRELTAEEVQNLQKRFAYTFHQEFFVTLGWIIVFDQPSLKETAGDVEKAISALGNLYIK